MSRKLRFTDQALERLKPPSVGRTELEDALCPGLILRITPRGVKTYSVQYRVMGEGGVTATGRQRQGVYHRITLGTTGTHGANNYGR